MSERRERAILGPEDSFQVVRAALSAELADAKQPRVMVTSPTGSEGKTVACVNLGRCFALAGQRVVIVDADLRHPDAHRQMDAHNDFGLTDLLLERRPPKDCLQNLQIPGLDEAAGQVSLLSTGPVAANPAELLSLERTAAMLDIVTDHADVTLVDTPPVLSVADASIVGRMVSGAVIVVQAHRTTVPELTRARDVLKRNQIRVLGVILNRFDARDAGYWENSPAATPPIPD